MGQLEGSIKLVHGLLRVLPVWGGGPVSMLDAEE